jgi:fatty acid desaturase
VVGGFPWWADLGLSLFAGHAFACGAFAAHEVLHGATVRSRFLQDVLGFVGFSPFLVSPSLWREWHNRHHHAAANQRRKDPDDFGGVRRYQRGGGLAFLGTMLPGSGTWYSSFFLFYWFTTHNLYVLLALSRRFPRFDRRPALIQTAAAGLLWAGVAAVSGWELLFTVAIPMLLGNGLVMSYIATNHFMRPETEQDDVLENSMSVRVPWIVDALHGWFSHHVEHHLFPGLSPASAPAVRAWLEVNAADRYVAPAFIKAIWWLYRTPRPHAGPRTLVHPANPALQIDLDALTEELRDDRWQRLKPVARENAA